MAGRKALSLGESRPTGERLCFCRFDFSVRYYLLLIVLDAWPRIMATLRNSTDAFVKKVDWIHRSPLVRAKHEHQQFE